MSTHLQQNIRVPETLGEHTEAAWTFPILVTAWIECLWHQGPASQVPTGSNGSNSWRRVLLSCMAGPVRWQYFSPIVVTAATQPSKNPDGVSLQIVLSELLQLICCRKNTSQYPNPHCQYQVNCRRSVFVLCSSARRNYWLVLFSLWVFGFALCFSYCLYLPLVSFLLRSTHTFSLFPLSLNLPFHSLPTFIL